jgi:hypothetical protein
MMPPNALSHDSPQGPEVLPPFESLYDRYHVQIYRYLYAHLRNEHDAADVMQRVLRHCSRPMLLLCQSHASMTFVRIC